MEKLLIIGGTGSLGNCLSRLLSKKYEISIISRDENKQWSMKKKFPDIKFHLGDIRNKDTIEQKIFEIRPHKIIIASALKHIDTCEYNITECILTNIIGIQNVIQIITNISNDPLRSQAGLPDCCHQAPSIRTPIHKTR